MGSLFSGLLFSCVYICVQVVKLFSYVFLVIVFVTLSHQKQKEVRKVFWIPIKKGTYERIKVNNILSMHDFSFAWG